MDIQSAYELNAPIERAWALLMDTEAIAACLPGCRGLRPLGNDRYAVDLNVGVAAITGSFSGTVAIEDKVAPTSYTLVIDGSGRQGFMKARAAVTLEADGDRTRVRIDAHADAGGMMARLGQRLLDGVARTMMDRFYSCLASRL